MALTDTEAIEALFDSAAGHLTLSPVTFQSLTTKESERIPSNRSDDPLSQWCSSSASSSTNTTGSSCGIHNPSKSSSNSNSSNIPNSSSTPNISRREVVPPDPINSTWNLESQASSHSSPLAKSYTPLPSPQLERDTSLQHSQFINPPCSPELSRSISCFDLIGTVGCGAYGKVLLGYLGNDFSHSLQAIKVLRKRDMHQYGMEEVRRELRALRWIAETVKNGENSPKGVSFLQNYVESFQNEDFVFIVLEYHPVSLANPEVARRLRLHTISPSAGVPTSVSLPLAFSPDLPSPLKEHESAMETLTLVAAELVLGIQFLHQSGIVHQDLKPANIMISETGHVVIADFGASTALPFSIEYDEDFSVTAESKPRKVYHSIVLQPQDIITFTPLYAAPELMFRNRAGLVIYDERVDWWSLGVLLYELATGHVPFPGPQVPIGTGGQKQKRLSRRSVGDFSLSFGALEKLVLTFRDMEESNDTGLQLDAFLRALLVEHAPDRLCSVNVKNHSFFDSVAHMWEGISALYYPPIPSPPTVSLDPDVSLGLNQQGSEVQCEELDAASQKESKSSDGHVFEQAGLRSTWPADDSTDKLASTHMSRALRETLSVESLAQSFTLSSSTSSRSDFVLDLDLDKHDVLDQEEESDGASQIQPFPSTASLYACGLDEDSVTSVEEGNARDEEVESEIEEWNPWSPSNSKEDLSHSPVSQEQDGGVDASFADVSANTRGGDEDESASTVSAIVVVSHKSPHFSDSPDVPHAIFSPRPGMEGLLLPRSQSQRQVSSSLHLPSRPPTPPSYDSSFIPSDDVEREMGAEQPEEWKTRSQRPTRRSASAPLPKRSTTFFTQTMVRPRSCSKPHMEARRSSPFREESGGSDKKKQFFKQGVFRSRSEHRQAKSTPSKQTRLRRGYSESDKDHRLDSSTGSNTTTGAKPWTMEERLTISVLNAMDSRDMNSCHSEGQGQVTSIMDARSSMQRVSWSEPARGPRMSNEDQFNSRSRPRALPPGVIGNNEPVSSSKPLEARTRLGRRPMKLVKRNPEENKKQKVSAVPKRSLGSIWKKFRRSLTLF